MSVPKTVSFCVPYPREVETDRLIIASEEFRGLLYEVKERSVIVFTPNNGILAIPLSGIDAFAEELKAIALHWW